MPALFGKLADDFTPEAPTAETAFRVAVLGNFSGRSDRRLLKVDRNNLDAVMAKLAPRVGIPADGAEIILKFASLDDFHPDEIVGRVDQFDDFGEDDKGDLMRSILHHADFQEMEAAWRGLDWFLRRALKGGQAEVFLCDQSFDAFAKDLTAGDDLRASGLYQALIEKSSRGPKAAPWALLLGLYLFDQTEAHANLLGRMARLGRRAAAPFLTGLSPRAAARGAEPDAAALPAWSALRQLPEAALLGLAAPRFLLRLPYGTDTKSIDKFDFEEFRKRKGDRPYLWGNGALAVAALLAEAFQKQSWGFTPGALTELGGMTLHAYTEDDEEQATLAEAWLGRTESAAMTKQGVMPLLCVRGRDALQLARYHSLAEPAKGQPPVALWGQWGQEGMVPLPSTAPPISVKVGMGLTDQPRTASAANTPAKTTANVPLPPASNAPAAAPAAAEEEDPEMAALMAQLDPPAAPAAPPAKEPAPAATEDEDPELAELMRQLGGGEETP
jgi:hypothetical protein